MSLFQPSVLKKYLSQQDTDQVQKAYKKYSKYFRKKPTKDKQTIIYKTSHQKL